MRASPFAILAHTGRLTIACRLIGSSPSPTTVAVSHPADSRAGSPSLAESLLTAGLRLLAEPADSN